MSLTEELSTLTAAAPVVLVPLVNVAEVAVVGKEVAVDVGREEEDCVAGTTDTRRRFLGGNSILLAPFGVESKEDFPDQWFFRGGTKVLKWLQMYNMATNLRKYICTTFHLVLVQEQYYRSNLLHSFNVISYKPSVSRTSTSLAYTAVVGLNSCPIKPHLFNRG